jgi:hypothetical protein
MNTKIVAQRFNVSFSTASHWATKNGVKRALVGGIFAFDWSEDDCVRFQNRPTKGKGLKKKDAPPGAVNTD